MTKNFWSELKHHIRYGIGAGVGVLIALAWREAIMNTATQFVQKFGNFAKISETGANTALLITIFGVLIIIISSKLLKD